MLRADLVLAGGGVKGVGHAGALSALFDAGYEFQRVAGTSAGSIVGALVAAGMPADQMVRLVRDLDYRRFRDASGVSRVPVVGAPVSLIGRDGAYAGAYVHDWLGSQLAELGVQTFKDLRLRADRGSTLTRDQRYRLVVMTADVTRGELIRLPWDYHDRYGLDPDEQLVADAVRASMSIPFFYVPASLRHHDGSVSQLMDGGVLTNYPIDTFDRTDDRAPRWPTFGITLNPPLPLANHTMFPALGLLHRGPMRLLEALITTMMVGHDQAYMCQPWVAARTLEVDTHPASVVDFDLTPAVRDELFANGRRAAERFLAGWDWDAYLRRYRTPAPAASDAVHT